MRRLPALLAPVLVLLIAAAPAYANHTRVGSSVRVIHGSNDVAVYLSQERGVMEVARRCGTGAFAAIAADQPTTQRTIAATIANAARAAAAVACPP